MSTLFYKFDLIIRQLWVILSCITLPLNAQIPDIISIDSTVEILNLNNVTLAWADSTAQADVLLAQKAFANLSFKPLAERQLGTKFERAKYSYWLTFALKNQSNDTITLYFNAIRSEFLDIWQEYKGHIERHYQAGKLVEKTTENGYFKGKYDVALSLYPNSEHRFYVCMRHEASVNATIKPMLFSLKQQLNRIQNYTFFNHLYGGFLAVVIFILLLTLFQYFINK